MSAVPDSIGPAGVIEVAGSAGFVAPATRVADLPGPRALPLVGNSLQVRRGSAHAVFEAWARRYGPIYRMRFGGHNALAVSEPGLIHELLRLRPKEARRAPRTSQLINELGPPGLFTAEGDAWRRQRRLVMRALTPEAVRHFFPVILEVTRRLEQRWRAAAADGRAVNVARELKRYSIDVTTWLALGVDVDTLTHEDNPLQEDVEYFFATIGRRLPKLFPYWRYVKLPADRRTDRVMARLHGVVGRLIAEARARLDAEPSLRAKPRNILEALIVARDEPGSEFTDDDVRGNVATMLFAGEDTTANAMAWLLYHLATTPRVAGVAAIEARAVLAGRDCVDGFDDIARLEYLDACAVESMRLKPIAPIQGVQLNVPMNLAGLHVPARQLVLLLPRVIGTDAAQFPEPLELRPERWLGAAADRIDDPRRKLFPFGGGPRFCPGRYLAMVEIKMVASMALANFGLALDVDAAEVREHFTFTLGPDAVPIRFSQP